MISFSPMASHAWLKPCCRCYFSSCQDEIFHSWHEDNLLRAVAIHICFSGLDLFQGQWCYKCTLKVVFSQLIWLNQQTKGNVSSLRTSVTTTKTWITHDNSTWHARKIQGNKLHQGLELDFWWLFWTIQDHVHGAFNECRIYSREMSACLWMVIFFLHWGFLWHCFSKIMKLWNFFLMIASMLCPFISVLVTMV